MTTSNITELRIALDAATNDSERLMSMLALAHGLLDNNPQESLQLSETGWRLAEHLGDEAAIAKARQLMGEANTLLGNYDLSREQLMHARVLYEKLGNSSGVAQTTADLGLVDSHVGDYARALEQLQSAIQLAEELGERKQIGSWTGTIGKVYQRLGEYDRALEKYHSALMIAQELGNRRSMMVCHGNIGIVYQTLGEFAKALEHCRITLALAEKLDARRNIMICQTTIARIYNSLGEYDRALEWMKAALVLAVKSGERREISSQTGNIGKVFLTKGEHALALEYFQSALALSREVDDRGSIASWTGNSGHAYVGLGEYDRALNEYQAALALVQELGERRNIALWTASMGDVYAMQNYEHYDLARAEEILLNAIDLADDKPFLFHVHEQLAELYGRQQQWKEAHHHLKHYYELKEEVENRDAYKQAQVFEYRRQINEMEKQHAIERAEAEMHRMKTDQLERDLSNATLQILAQTELLAHLRNDLLKIAHKIPPTEPGARELRERIKNLPCQSVDWEKFDRQFKAVHPEFIRNLTHRAPELTATEVRICTMLRMNLKSHEMASLFCITEAGVEFHRRNIRKKLKLQREEKLPLVLGGI